MDMSFLIKSFLPPGVSVEMLQEAGKEALTKILAAAQRIEQTHALLTEQNAMLRHIIATSQAPSFTIQQETPDDHDQHPASAAGSPPSDASTDASTDAPGIDPRQ